MNISTSYCLRGNMGHGLADHPGQTAVFATAAARNKTKTYRRCSTLVRTRASSASERKSDETVEAKNLDHFPGSGRSRVRRPDDEAACAHPQRQHGAVLT